MNQVCEAAGSQGDVLVFRFGSQSKLGGELLFGSLKHVTSDTFVELGALEPEVQCRQVSKISAGCRQASDS